MLLKVVNFNETGVTCVIVNAKWCMQCLSKPVIHLTVPLGIKFILPNIAISCLSFTSHLLFTIIILHAGTCKGHMSCRMLFAECSF